MGGYYAHYVSHISPRILGLDTFLLILLMVIIGGMGMFPGAFIGSFIVTFLSELLRPLELYRMLVFGAIMMLLVILAPKGFMGFLDTIDPYVFKGFRKDKSEV